MRLLAPVIAAALALVSPAAAQMGDIVCLSDKGLNERLKRDYGARREGYGVRTPDTMIEVWVIPRTGEWTLVQRYAGGRACIVAMGQHWEGDLPPA